MQKPPPNVATLIRVVAISALFLAPWVRAQQGGQELEGKVVSRITFEGLERFTPEAVQARMRLQVGRPFSRAALEEDLKTLAGHQPETAAPPPTPGQTPSEAAPPPKVFAVIPSARAELDGAGGVVVTIQGLENRTVAGVVYLGAVDFGREEFLLNTRTRTGAPVDDFVLELDRLELERFYRAQGYHYVEVNVTKTTEILGDLIVFKIAEGPKVSIRSVEFRGATAFSKGDLLDEMPFTDEPGFLSSQEFVQEQVLRDVVQLRNFYLGKGYLDSQVTLLESNPSPDFEDMDLVILVEEGPLYLVRSVTVEGLTLFDPEEVVRGFRTQVGGPYEQGFDLRLDVRDLEERIQEFGYTEVEIRDASTFGREANEVDVRLVVTEGSLVYVGRIEIRGNEETQDRVVRREIELYTGEPLNLKKLQRARNRIRALGYWTPQTGVGMDTPPIPLQGYQLYKDVYLSLQDTDRKNIKDIIFTLEERDTGSLRFAAGIGSNSGVIGDVTYTKSNFDPFDFPEGLDDVLDAFTGGGQLLVLSVQPGTVFSRWRVAWTNPRVFDGPFSVGGEVYQTQWRREDWDESRLGYALRTGRRVGEDLYASLTLRDELVDVDDVDDDAPQLVFDFEGENRITTLTLNVRLNRLNDFVNPTDGYLADVDFEHAGLWGDIEFNRIFARGDYYFEAFEDASERLHVVRLRSQLGWASEFGDTRDIPVFERFYAGGAGSIRGFRFRGVGPMDNDSPTGGKALWIAGAEYQFPLFGDTFRGVAFVDSGSVANDWDSDDIWKPRLSAGFGIRLVIPFLSQDRPLAIDFGIPILKDGDDETEFISFSFGSR